MNPIKSFYKRRNQRLKSRGVGVRFDYDRPAEDYDWITINGSHAPIDDAGNIAGGAGGKFIGKKYTGTKMQSAKKASRVSPVSKSGANGIKGKSLAKRVRTYMKENGGKMPDKAGMHDFAYEALSEAIKKERGLRDKMRSLPEPNLARRMEIIERDLKFLEDRLPELKGSSVERTKELIEHYRQQKQETEANPNYARDKKLWDGVRGAAQEIIAARHDAAQYMYNKGTDFKTAAEVEMYIDSTGWVEPVSDDYILENGYSSKVNVQALDRTVYVSIADAIGTYSAKFPAFKEIVSGIYGSVLPPGRYGGFTPDTNEVELSLDYFADTTIKNGKKAYEDDLKAGFHPKGTGIDSTPYHEFTHAMEDAMRRDDKNRKKALKNVAPSTVILNRVLKRFGVNEEDKDFLKGMVSAYAKKTYPARPEYNDSEFLAEAMSEAYCSKKPREIAVAVREEFERLYHEVYD